VSGLFPDWLIPLPDAPAMHALDRWAIEQRGVPSLDLMERAGAGVTRAVERLAPAGRVAVLCGKGNNGGDGLVVARLLRDAGREVSVHSVASAAELSGDARTNLDRLPGPPPVQIAAGGTPGGGETLTQALAPVQVVVDALLGTGFAGEPHGTVAEAIAVLAGLHTPIVSVDVPSGVDASTGEVAAAAVSARVTVTFQHAKPGLWIHPGKAHAGAVEVLDIGIPRRGPLAADVGLISSSVLQALPRRGAASTKFSSGHVLVVGGSRGLTGAPRMAALGAMRAGAGYVTACVPAEVQAILATGPPELMTRGLPDADGALTQAGVEQTLAATARAGALALGPGLGRRGEAAAFARDLAGRAEVPLVLDADGLNAHVGYLQQLAKRPPASVLTPHAGELARLLESDSETIERRRLAHARVAAQRAGAVVVLKGDDTLVADPSGLVGVSPGDSPGLATAGTGDVLCGVVAALLSQGLDPFPAACAAVSLHAQAGRLAARTVGSAEGVIASDVIAALPAARAGEHTAAPGEHTAGPGEHTAAAGGPARQSPVARERR
jgi:ADP-dependent NAD(P)H-hydrate dehydratase / NAD(P)H-hydrate epimerase